MLGRQASDRAVSSYPLRRRKGEGQLDAVMLALVDAVTVIPDDATRAALLETLAGIDRPTTLTFVNAHACNLAVSDAAFRHDLLAADVQLRDGKGLQILLQQLGLDAGLNLNGTDLIPRLIETFRGRPVALFGTADPWLRMATEQIGRICPVLLTCDGFQTDDHYVAALRDAPVDLIVLAMGMPKQERVAARLRETLDRPCLIVCGGAILDFVAGRVNRSPVWMRASGLEWLYRLALEPRRLFRRYALGNALFLVRTARLARAHRRTLPRRGDINEPEGSLRR